MIMGVGGLSGHPRVAQYMKQRARSICLFRITSVLDTNTRLCKNVTLSVMKLVCQMRAANAGPLHRREKK